MSVEKSTRSNFSAFAVAFAWDTPEKKSHSDLLRPNCNFLSAYPESVPGVGVFDLRDVTNCRTEDHMDYNRERRDSKE